MSAARDLLQRALALTPQERAEIARELLDSLAPPGIWTETEGVAEIERRAKRVLKQGPSGETWPEVRAEIERDLGS